MELVLQIMTVRSLKGRLVLGSTIDGNVLQWETVPLHLSMQGYDLVICADVIEHLVDPDELLGFIERCQPKVIVLSTPDRNKMRPDTRGGPPSNFCHVREWAWDEFFYYIGDHFKILEHISFGYQQYIVCEPYASGGLVK